MKSADHNFTVAWLLKDTYSRITNIPVRIRNISSPRKLPHVCFLSPPLIHPPLISVDVFPPNKYLSNVRGSGTKHVVGPYVYIWKPVCHLIKCPYFQWIYERELVTILPELSPALGGDRGDHGMVPVFKWWTWLRGNDLFGVRDSVTQAVLCPPTQEDLGPHHYFQMSVNLGGSHLILTSSPSCPFVSPLLWIMRVLSSYRQGECGNLSILWHAYEANQKCLNETGSVLCNLSHHTECSLQLLSAGSLMSVWKWCKNAENLGFSGRFLRKERGANGTHWLVRPLANGQRLLHRHVSRFTPLWVKSSLTEKV